MHDVITSDEWPELRERLSLLALEDQDVALRDTLPVLAALDDHHLSNTAWQSTDVDPLPRRVYHALLEFLIGRDIATTWGELGLLSIRHLRHVSGMGSSSLGSLVQFLVDESGRVGRNGAIALGDGMVVDHTMPLTDEAESGLPGEVITVQAPPPPSVEPEDVVKNVLTPLVDQAATIALWARSELGDVSLEEALRRAAGETAPVEVREALELLRLAHVPRVAPLDVSLEVERFLDALGPKRRDVFVARVLQPPEGTLEMVGDRLGITRERVRQIAIAANQTAHGVLRHKRSRSLRWRAATLRDRLGPVFPDDHEWTTTIVADAFGTVPAAVPRAFMFWAAGPYSLREGIWYIDGIWNQDTFQQAIAQAVGDDGLEPEALTAYLTGLGCPEPFHQYVIDAVPVVHMFMGRYVKGRLSIQEKCAIALDALGRPATIDELLRVADMTNPASSVSNVIQAGEHIMRVSKDEFGLRRWGLEEYAGIADAIARAIEARGGIADVTDLEEELPTAFGVSKTSVRAYCSAPMFVLEGDRVRMRLADEPFTVVDPLAPRRSVYRFEHLVALAFEVDRDALRGSGRPLMPNVTQALGVSPGSATTFAGDGFEVRISWPMTGWSGGSIGSLRGAMAAAGAVKGDRLRLLFDTKNQRVTVAAHNPSLIAELGPMPALQLLTGVPADSPAAALHMLDVALDMPLAGLEAALRARGDGDVADIVETLR